MFLLNRKVVQCCINATVVSKIFIVILIMSVSGCFNRTYVINNESDLAITIFYKTSIEETYEREVKVYNEETETTETEIEKDTYYRTVSNNGYLTPGEQGFYDIKYGSKFYIIYGGVIKEYMDNTMKGENIIHIKEHHFNIH
jgi:hypothetical protein